MQYLENLKIAETDMALIKLFASIGYPDIDKKRYSDLFFSNFALGYRNNKCNSGNMTADIMRADASFAKRLIDILEPEVVICLGKDTYTAAISVYGKKIASGSFNIIIEESGDNPITVKTESDKEVRIFPVAHCGPLGTINRNKGLGKGHGRDLTRQLNNWSKLLN